MTVAASKAFANMFGQIQFLSMIGDVGGADGPVFLKDFSKSFEWYVKVGVPRAGAGVRKPGRARALLSPEFQSSSAP